MFAASQRPTLAELARLIEAPELAGAGASVSFAPDDEAGWAELLVNGLTFDCAGLAPHPPEAFALPRYRYGVSPGLDLAMLEAITIVPGQHLRTALAVIPVVRAMLGLASALALPLGARAVVWGPAGTCMEPAYFARVVLNWMSGGAFPVPGLIGIEHGDDDSVTTSGLAYFIGQEARLASVPGEARAQSAKLAIRMVDYLVRNGPVDQPCDLSGPDGEAMRALPAGRNGKVEILRQVT